jgi:hypothetical protein
MNTLAYLYQNVLAAEKTFTLKDVLNFNGFADVFSKSLFTEFSAKFHILASIMSP